MDESDTQQQLKAADASLPTFFIGPQLVDENEVVAISIRMEDGTALGGEEAVPRQDDHLLVWFGSRTRMIPGDAAESLGSIELGTSSPSTSTAIISPASVGEVDPDLDDENQAPVQVKDATPTTKSATSCLGRLLTMYSDSLESRPVLTKAISSGLIGLLGDLTAQSIEWGFKSSPAPWSGSQAIWRSCAVMLDGFFVNGPLLHYAYEGLEKHLPAKESLLSAFMQVGVDIFVIDPVFAFLFVWSTGLIEGRSVRKEILKTIEHSYPEMVGWLILIGLCWAPIQIYLFNRYPVKFRVLVADLIDLVWTCVTSLFCHV